jgi:hypothetical protein
MNFLKNCRIWIYDILEITSIWIIWCDSSFHSCKIGNNTKNESRKCRNWRNPIFNIDIMSIRSEIELNRLPKLPDMSMSLRLGCFGMFGRLFAQVLLWLYSRMVKGVFFAPFYSCLLFNFDYLKSLYRK